MSIKFSSLAPAIKRERKKLGFTQEQFANEFGVSTQTVRNWEQGVSYPEAKTLEALCEFFQCDMDYLFGRLDCRTHDLQYMCDYTGLDEIAVETLHESLKDDKATMFVLSRLIKRSDSILKKIVTYYASAFESKVRTNPFHYLPGNPKELKARFFFADLFDAIPSDTKEVFQTFKDDPVVSKQMIFKLIRESADYNWGDRAITELNKMRNEVKGDNPRIGIIAEFLASDIFFEDRARKAGLNLEDYFYKEQEAENGAD